MTCPPTNIGALIVERNSRWRAEMGSTGFEPVTFAV